MAESAHGRHVATDGRDTRAIAQASTSFRTSFAQSTRVFSALLTGKSSQLLRMWQLAALLLLAVAPALMAAPPPPPAACPVEGGVVDAARCAGYSPADATDALQAAFHSGAHTVLIKNQSMTPWLLTTTVWLGSNQTVKLSPGAVIEAKRFAPFWNDSKTVSEPHPLISTAQAGSFNVTIQGAAGVIIRMHKADYMNPKLYPIHNEWRYGLFLSSGSRHISVSDLTISAAGGDGICIAYAASDIHLARLVLDDNYRNALTITNGKDLLIEDCVFSNTSGTAPSAGVDIEPDWAWSDLSNITFRRCQFVRNWGAGFSMAPGGIRPWNRTQYPGVPYCARELNSRDGNNSACPISVSIEQSYFEGFDATPGTPCASPCAAGVVWPVDGAGPPAAADCKYFDCTGCVFQTPTCSSTGEQFGILYAGIHRGVPGTFRVSDTTIANTALSGAEKLLLLASQFMLKTIILPTQARDKHKETLKRRRFVQACSSQRKPLTERCLWCEKLPCLILLRKMIVLPRQARDKHIGNLERKGVLCRSPTSR